MARTFGDQRWRLNNLYHIENKQGRIVPFRMNDAQVQFYERMWYLNVILKARQLGFSTLVAMLWLDVCLFNSATRCGIVDATIDDAKKKLKKVKIAYGLLPDWLKQWNPITTENAFSIEFKNGSGIEVGTSHRGGTLQYLHVSELGKIAAKFPEKAREIRTGALNTVQAGQICVIESTAEGQDGDFYDVCQTAEAKARMRAKLTPLDFRFHFFPWHQAPEYVLPADGVPIPDPLARYFAKLEADEGITLSPEQRAWYVKKVESQRDDMKREFPSTSREAFEASIEGAIFGPQIAMLEANGRIGAFKAEPDVPVHMFFDIGRSDYTSIWFAQVLMGPIIRVVGFYQNCLVELPHYVEYCFGTAQARKSFPDIMFGEPKVGVFERKGWKIGKAYFPHDVRVTEWGSGRSRIEQAMRAGFDAKQATELSIHDGINAARSTLAFCQFDAEDAAEGVKMLRGYRWEWDDQRGVWKTGTPRHGTESHGADAFRYLGTSWREIVPTVVVPKKPEHWSMEVRDGMIIGNMDVTEIVKMKERLAKMSPKRGLQL